MAEILNNLVQLAMISNKEVLQNIQSGNPDELSTHFKTICDNVYEYAIDILHTTNRNNEKECFEAYNAIAGYLQNVRSYKDDEAKLKSLLLGGIRPLRSQKKHLIFAKNL